jgi:hypothetical protein
MADKPLRYCMFVVDERPFCVWDWDLQARTLSFLDGIDPNYFIYLADVYTGSSDGEQQQYAALAIRTMYAQALETLFAFLGAALQAPLCVPAWLAKYQNAALDSLIGKIGHWKPVYSSLGYRALLWEEVSALIHTNLIFEDKAKEQTIKREFAGLWARLAGDFLSDKAGREYNSIKHGFRVRPGGFSLALGIEEQPGIPAPPKKMRLIGKSNFGSNFLIPETIGTKTTDKHHFRLKRYSLNWNPQDMLYGLRLIAMSLSNIIAYLKVTNGVDLEAVQFQWPIDAAIYQEPWARQRKMGVSGLGWFETDIPEDLIEKFTGDKIRSVYKDRKSTETDE